MKIFTPSALVLLFERTVAEWEGDLLCRFNFNKTSFDNHKIKMCPFDFIINATSFFTCISVYRRDLKGNNIENLTENVFSTLKNLDRL